MSGVDLVPWKHVRDGLPDSDEVVVVVGDGLVMLAELEFTDDSEGRGKPYWSGVTSCRDLSLEEAPHWTYGPRRREASYQATAVEPEGDPVVEALRGAVDETLCYFFEQPRDEIPEALVGRLKAGYEQSGSTPRQLPDEQHAGYVRYLESRVHGGDIGAADLLHSKIHERFREGESVDIDRVSALIDEVLVSRKAFPGPHKKSTNPRPAEAYLDENEIVIRIDVDALQAALEANPRDDAYSKCKVDDPQAFARAVVEKLNEEEEDGTTSVHRALDKAMAAAIDDGCEGVEFKAFEP